LPDPRNKYFGIKNFSEFRRSITKLALTSNQHEDVAIAFNTARNLFLYSWYVYRFFPVSELQALASLEFALRRVAKQHHKKTRNLGPLLSLAISENWISEKNILQFQRLKSLRETATGLFMDLPYTLEASDPLPIPEYPNYLDVLKKVLPELRNIYAHGDSVLKQPASAYLTLEICRDLIDQLPYSGTSNFPS
jgi:hypothetical protein